MADTLTLNGATPHNWTILQDFSRMVTALSQEKGTRSLQSLLDHVSALESKVNHQEAVIEANENAAISHSNEIQQLERNHREKQEEVTEVNTRLLRKRDDENTAMGKVLTRQEEELRQAKVLREDLEEHNKSLEEKIVAQDAAVKQLEDRLREVRFELKRAQETINNQQSQIKSRDESLLLERKTHDQSKSEVSLIQRKCAGLEEDLRSSRESLLEIDQLAPALCKDDIAAASERFEKLWKQCVRLASRCFATDSPEERLQERANWKALSDSDLFTWAFPLPPTNTQPARRMRMYATLTILASELVNQVFVPSYHFEDGKGLEKLMIGMTETSLPKESLLRRILNSPHVEADEKLIEQRVTRVQNKLTDCIGSLINSSQSEKLQQDLADVVRKAAQLWCSVQKQQSRFAVEDVDPSQTTTPWNSLVWNSADKKFVEKSIHPPNDYVSVLFPRIFVMQNESEVEVFPGAILVKSETTEASNEWERHRTSATSPTKSTMSGPSRRRRPTVTNDSFLSQNGSREA